MSRDLVSPREKYMNDTEYHHLVQTLEHLIESARFTPSELREACVLASINYEMRHIRDMKIDPKAEDCLQYLDKIVSSRRPR